MYIPNFFWCELSLNVAWMLNHVAKKTYPSSLCKLAGKQKVP